MPLYSVKQKESINDVVINPDLSSEQQDEVRSLLREYIEIIIHYRVIFTYLGARPGSNM